MVVFIRLMLLATVLCFSPVSIGQQLNAKAVNFELSTQFDVLNKYSFPNNKKTILVFADRHSSKQTKEWTAKLRADFKEDIQIVGIACMGWVPFFIKGSVMASFKDKPPILLDWSNEVADQYGYIDEEGLLVYIDPSGIVRHSVRGVFKEEAYKLLKATISI